MGGKVRDGKLEEKDIIMPNNEKSNGETISGEYIAALESELEVKLAKIKSFEVISVFLIGVGALCFIFHMYIVYGSN